MPPPAPDREPARVHPQQGKAVDALNITDKERDCASEIRAEFEHNRRLAAPPPSTSPNSAHKDVAGRQQYIAGARSAVT